MAARNTGGDRLSEEFEPVTEWMHEAGADTLVIYLPGFRKEQLRVQVTSLRKLRVTGERLTAENKWSRFRLEIPILSNYDTNQISAKYEKGILYVKHPKMIVQVEQEQKTEPPVEAPMPQKPPEAKPEPRLEVPKPQKPPQATAELTKETLKPQKSPQEKAQPPPVEVPKPRKPEVQEKLQAPVEAPKPEKPTQEKLQPIAEAPKPRKTINGEPSKTSITEKEKEPSRYEQEENGPIGDIATISRRRKMETYGDSVEDAARREKGKEVARFKSWRDKIKMENYQQTVSGLVKEMKEDPRKLVNLILVVLAVLVLGLYTKNAIKYLIRSEE